MCRPLPLPPPSLFSPHGWLEILMSGSGGGGGGGGGVLHIRLSVVKSLLLYSAK